MYYLFRIYSNKLIQQTVGSQRNNSLRIEATFYLEMTKKLKNKEFDDLKEKYGPEKTAKLQNQPLGMPTLVLQGSLVHTSVFYA